ncbi:hypothetical protein [Methanobacterium sp. SMA-27]|uniref:hypothetical protein n=1 Tax=Methanobacterium sp. SMA-27 TaxID=1495336 RepID=UPI00064FF116|nr:hypothetical protein [Methanobacterium sp. SMA-27]
MKSTRNSIILLVLIALIAVAVSGCTSNTNSTSVNQSSTKVAFFNNGSTWFHFNAVIENMTLKNGTVQNFYVDGYMKPGGNVTLDLSSIAGYGNQQLPAGTTVRVMAWKGLFNQTINSTTNSSTMELVMQGWSKTLNPTSNDTAYNVSVPNLPVNQLPANITNSTLIIGTDPALIQGSGNNSTMLPIFEEEIFTVDANGKVTMVFVTPATLCNILAI